MAFFFQNFFGGIFIPLFVAHFHLWLHHSCRSIEEGLNLGIFGFGMSSDFIWALFLALFYCLLGLAISFGINFVRIVPWSNLFWFVSIWVCTILEMTLMLFFWDFLELAVQLVQVFFCYLSRIFIVLVLPTSRDFILPTSGDILISFSPFWSFWINFGSFWFPFRHVCIQVDFGTFVCVKDFLSSWSWFSWP